MSIDLRFEELTDKQRDSAREKYPDAGTCRDNYWYTVSMGFIMCRNPITKPSGDFYNEDEGLY